MIRDLRELAPGDEWDARIRITLRRVGRMDEYDLHRWIAMCPPTHPVRLAAEGELRRRAALEAEEPLWAPGGPLARQELRRSQIQRVLDALPRHAPDAVRVLGDAIVVLAGLCGANPARVLGNVLRSHASLPESLAVLADLETQLREAN